jgi:uncharacterized protein (DUF983 family)
MPHYLQSTFTCKCPRCRKGDLFHSNQYFKKGYTQMKPNCITCGQPTEIEVGFYYGTGYVSYALTVAISVATLVAWYVLIGMSVDDNRWLGWLLSNTVLLLVLQRWLRRLSRSIWISWFVSYDKDWKTHPLENFERMQGYAPEQ